MAPRTGCPAGACTRTARSADPGAGHDAGGSAGLVEDFPADQHAAEFAGAGAGVVELGVAQQAPGRIVVDVAVAAQALDGVERDRGRALRRIEDRARRVL